MPVKAVKAPPPPPFDPWDIAFGSAIMNDYIFRGITQSNHKPSVAAYFEPRYNVNKDLQLYIGISAESISFPNRAAAEVDIYGGIRPTFGMFAFDFGVWGYLYPGGQLLQFGAFPARHPGGELPLSAIAHANLPLNGNVLKKDASFFEGLWQGELHLQRQVRSRRERVLFAELPQHRRLGQLRVDHRQVDRAEHDLRHQRRRHVRLGRIRPPVARNLGLLLRTLPAGAAVPERHSTMPSYNTWNIGIGFTYKVFTLDLRYSDTNLSKGNCNAFTSDFTATGTDQRHPDQSERRRLQLVRRSRHRQALG